MTSQFIFAHTHIHYHYVYICCVINSNPTTWSNIFGNFIQFFLVFFCNFNAKNTEAKNAKFSKNAKWLFIEKRNVAFNNKAIKKSGLRLDAKWRSAVVLLQEEENKK